LVMMAAISNRRQQQDGRIRPLPRWKMGSTSTTTSENLEKYSVGFRLGRSHT
jgi:hypothetical protein